MGKLTSKNNKFAPKRLISNEKVDKPFIMSFRRKLESGYQFPALGKQELKLLQKFLDIASELTVSEMDKRYKRDSDKQDTIDGQNVVHYEAGYSFRIHGIYKNGLFEVVRLDPQHKVHKK